MESVFVVAVAIAAAGIAAVGVAFLMRRMQPDGVPGAAAMPDPRIALMEAELSALREARFSLERRLAVEEQKASRLPAIEAALAERTAAAEALRDAKTAIELDLAKTAEALAQTKDARDSAFAQAEAATADLRRRLDETASTLKTAQDEAAALRTGEARLQETLAQEKKHSEARFALLTEAKERMSQEFKLLAEEVMRNHGDTFSKQNKEQIDGLLAPLRDKLGEFQQGLQNAHNESAKERATLGEQIRNLTLTSAQMTSETGNLTRALKGKTQTQGAWGEMILATILERSGLREGEEYVTQESHSSEDGGRMRPDVVVNLPGGERVVIDSKVSLTAFEACINADSDAGRTLHLKAHLTSLRTHIKALGSKEYHNLTGDGLDYVIMFVPIEGALAAALQEDPKLTVYAAENNVAIATPTTLMIALRTIANVWRVERRNRNAEEIAARAGRIYDKLNGFVENMTNLGMQLNRAAESYDGAMKQLSTGKGNLIAQAELLKAMGAKTSKSLPKHLRDDGDGDADAEVPPPSDSTPQRIPASLP